MVGRVARYPAGLLGLLDLKTGGQSPPDFGSVLLPTLEAFPFYVNSLIRNRTGSWSVAAGVSGFQLLGAVLTETGPTDGHVWYVRNLGIWSSTVAVAAESYIGRLSVLPSGIGTTAGQVFDGAPLTITPTQRGAAGVGNFWMQPGDKIALFTEENVGAAAKAGFWHLTFADFLY